MNYVIFPLRQIGEADLVGFKAPTHLVLRLEKEVLQLLRTGLVQLGGTKLEQARLSYKLPYGYGICVAEEDVEGFGVQDFPLDTEDVPYATEDKALVEQLLSDDNRAEFADYVTATIYDGSLWLEVSGRKLDHNHFETGEFDTADLDAWTIGCGVKRIEERAASLKEALEAFNKALAEDEAQDFSQHHDDIFVAAKDLLDVLDYTVKSEAEFAAELEGT